MRRVVVVGGGHAGCEAAAAVARAGFSTVLVNLPGSRLAEMPCNPAVGGIGKGHLVVELDALGGLQGWATDRAGIQFRVLNRSRGPAVWGPRAQCDKERYSEIMTRVLGRLRHLELVEGEVTRVLTRAGRVEGVELDDGSQVAADTVILTTGTFLRGVMHTGSEQSRGGRFAERPSEGLGVALHELGFELRRFKTGTPPRIHRRSIDFSRLEEQDGDADPRPFSWRSRAVRNRAVCWIGRTNEAVQAVIAENVDRSPLFSGIIDGTGPRYCPSIEDKVVRFPHHREHTVFVEPEGLETASMYLNGLSTSLPRDVQERVVRALPGFEGAEFLRYGYAVEYDVIAPGQVASTLEAKEVKGLYFAGQVLGTSGYEEAAALGLVAGLNAVARRRGDEPWIPAREESYIGVMVDDLVHREHREPYRMFTSRAEHRLLLGVDSARERLMAKGVEWGLVSERAFHVEQARWQRREKARERLESWTLRPDRETRTELQRSLGVDISAPTTMARLLVRSDLRSEDVAAAVPDLDAVDLEIVRGRLRYAGYRERAERERARVQRLRAHALPASFWEERIPGLSREIVENLRRERPHDLAAAEKVPGMTPAALAILAALVDSGGGAGDS